MTNFQVIPSALNFGVVNVAGPVPGLVPNPASTKNFTFYNNSGASITITSYGFTQSTDGDAVTQPAGILPDTDFTIAATSFPVTVANGANQSFTVTYAPQRRGSGFGDVRSALLMLYAGNKAISNGGQVVNSNGEVLNNAVPSLVVVGVGGGVIEEAYDWATVAPMYQGPGSRSNYNAPAGYGDGAPDEGLGGLGANFTLADLDTAAHYSPMMFWAAPQTADVGPSAYVAPVPAAYTTATTTVPYALMTPYSNGSPKGGRSYQVLIFWGADTQTFNLTIKAHRSTADVVVASWTGLTPFNSSGLFIGNTEGLDLQGLELTATTSGGTYSSASYNIGAVITG